MKAILVLLLGSVGACGALADEREVRTASDVAVVFDSLDRNDDQRISRQEARNERTLIRRFGGVDADRDGYLSKAEFEARPSPERFE